MPRAVMIRPFSLWLAVLVAALFAAGGPGRAQIAVDPYRLSVLPGWRGADGVHVAALELRLAPGWNTYWRSPGEVGIPPQFDWRRSRNLKGVEIVWPAPRVIEKFGARAIGYTDVVILPLRVLPDRAGRDVVLNGQIGIGVCREVCLPVDLKVSLRLPAAAGARDPRIVAALLSQPVPAAEAGVRRAVCRLTPIAGGLGLRAEIDLPGAAAYDAAVIETDNPQIWVAPSAVSRTGGRVVADTRLYHAEGRSFALDRSGIRITVLGRSRAVDIQGCAAG